MRPWPPLEPRPIRAHHRPSSAMGSRKVEPTMPNLQGIHLDPATPWLRHPRCWVAARRPPTLQTPLQCKDPWNCDPTASLVPLCKHPRLRHLGAPLRTSSSGPEPIAIWNRTAYNSRLLGVTPWRWLKITKESAMPSIPSEVEVLGYFKELSNWGRWGKDDEAGALNLITPDVRRAAVAEVSEGSTV